MSEASPEVPNLDAGLEDFKFDSVRVINLVEAAIRECFTRAAPNPRLSHEEGLRAWSLARPFMEGLVG
jgi:hypothetical protein